MKKLKFSLGPLPKLCICILSCIAVQTVLYFLSSGNQSIMSTAFAEQKAVDKNNVLSDGCSNLYYASRDSSIEIANEGSYWLSPSYPVWKEPRSNGNNPQKSVQEVSKNERADASTANSSNAHVSFVSSTTINNNERNLPVLNQEIREESIPENQRNSIKENNYYSVNQNFSGFEQYIPSQSDYFDSHSNSYTGRHKNSEFVQESYPTMQQNHFIPPEANYFTPQNTYPSPNYYGPGENSISTQPEYFFPMQENSSSFLDNPPNQINYYNPRESYPTNQEYFDSRQQRNSFIPPENSSIPTNYYIPRENYPSAQQGYFDSRQQENFFISSENNFTQANYYIPKEDDSSIQQKYFVPVSENEFFLDQQKSPLNPGEKIPLVFSDFSEKQENSSATEKNKHIPKYFSEISAEPHAYPFENEQKETSQQATQQSVALKEEETPKKIEAPIVTAHSEPEPALQENELIAQVTPTGTETSSQNSTINSVTIPPFPFSAPPSVSLANKPAADAATIQGMKEISINFNNVSMVEYIRFISRISNKNFVFDDEDLQFNVTIVSEEPTSIDNLMAALLQELKIRDLSLMEQGNNIIIHRNTRVRSPSRIVADGPQLITSRESELVTRVFRLNTLDPMKASEIIRPLLSDSALVEVLRDSNNLIITDLVTNINKISQLIDTLDAPNSGITIGQYFVRNAFVDSLVDLTSKLLQPIAQGNPFVLVPNSISNSIFIVSNPFIVEKAVAILENLDVKEGRTKVLSLENLYPTSVPSSYEREKNRAQQRNALSLEDGRQYSLGEGIVIGADGQLYSTSGVPLGRLAGVGGAPTSGDGIVPYTALPGEGRGIIGPLQGKYYTANGLLLGEGIDVGTDGQLYSASGMPLGRLAGVGGAPTVGAGIIPFLALPDVEGKRQGIIGPLQGKYYTSTGVPLGEGIVVGADGQLYSTSGSPLGRLAGVGGAPFAGAGVIPFTAFPGDAEGRRQGIIGPLQGKYYTAAGAPLGEGIIDADGTFHSIAGLSLNKGSNGSLDSSENYPSGSIETYGNARSRSPHDLTQIQGEIGSQGRSDLYPGAIFDESHSFLPGGISSSSRWSNELPEGHLERTLFFIYKLRYRKGDQIEVALRKIADSLRITGKANVDLVSAINSSQWLESSNSLIFTGSEAALQKVKGLIGEVDIPSKQVFIEMLILETSVEDSLTYGVEWDTVFGGGPVTGGQNFAGLGGILLNTVSNALDTTNSPNIDIAGGLSSTTTAPITQPIFGTDGYTASVIGTHVTHHGTRFNSIGALVRAIHDDSKTNIIMNPKIITEDNNTAEIFVGFTDRYKTQTISNDLGSILTSNFQFIDVGTTLRVTPLIGNNGIITLDIIQETSNGSGSANTGTNSNNVSVNLVPVLSKSRTVTKVHIPDGFFIILSGMMQETEVRSVSRIPCLGGIPILGAAAKSSACGDNKRNLMIFIRPVIIDTEEDIEDITKRQQDVFRQKSKQRRRWNFEVNEALSHMNVKSTDPDERTDCNPDCCTVPE